MLRPTQSLARAQVLTTVAVVIAFVAASVAAGWTARSIDQKTEMIAQDTMPSVSELTSARVALHHINLHIERAMLARTPISSAAISSMRDQMDRAIEAYRALPAFAQEVAPANTLEVIRNEEDHALDELLAGRGSIDDEIAIADRLDEQLAVLVELNSEAGADLARSAEHTRERAMETVAVLDIAGILFAIAATLGAVALQRRTVQSLERDRERAFQHASALESRTTELTERASELEMFSGRIAHDLTSPLMSLSLTLDMLQGDPRRIARARRNLGHVRRLVDGLLHFAQAGARPDRRASADLKGAIDSVVESVEALAQEMSTRVEVHDFAACTLSCSAGVLESILGNLLTNAIKYMDGTDRRVDIFVRDLGTHTVVEVHDTGPGISEELRETLFDPFSRAKNTHVSGIGLGLATVKRLVEAHGGRVGHRAAKERGTIFWVDLPSVPAPVLPLDHHV